MTQPHLEPPDGERFVADLPPELAGHQAILRKLMAAAQAWPAARWLVLSCSIARGAADVHSDIDLGLGLDEAELPAALDGLVPFVKEGGEVLDLLEQRLARFEPRPHRHLFVQYADGLQVDITAAGSSYLTGYPLGEIVLYDTDHALVTPAHKPGLEIDAARIREWAFLGWWSLGDLAKYLERGSAWEAKQRLDDAREQVFRLWGVAHGVHDAQWGHVALLDRPDIALPPRIDQTVASLELGSLRDAALVVADLLTDASERAAATDPGVALPSALAAHVRQRLAAVQ